MVENDLNMFSLMESLHKIKATLSVLVDDDPSKLDKIKTLYLQETTIVPNHPKEHQFSDFLEFMQRDERENIEMHHSIKEESVDLFNASK